MAWLRALLFFAVGAVFIHMNTTVYAAKPAVRGETPLSQGILVELKKRSMTKESPILIRIFKKESQLEIWKEETAGRFALFKAYVICRWSGVLGPKMKEGDRQSPEGFYAATHDSLNPKSKYFLSVNVGFPNMYDRAQGRTGSFVMIHGGCASVGCFAMRNEKITEIFALLREAFSGGQVSIQIQIYPFRMTKENMAKNRRSRHIAFWKMLKEGYDIFENTRKELQIDVCEGKYLFDASGVCPKSSQ